MQGGATGSVVQVPRLPEVTNRHVTLRFSLVCAHAHPQVAQYLPYWGLFTRSDVMKRHPVVTECNPNEWWKGCAHAQRNIRPSGAFSPEVSLGVLSRTSASIVF